MATERINNLNSALMAMSALLAFIAPFEVFLLAYVVLGPLHYLTEISWLYDRNCFLARKREAVPLILLLVVLLLAGGTNWPSERKNEIVTLVNYAAFVGAAMMIAAGTRAAKLVAGPVIVVSFLVVWDSEPCAILFGLLLPTVIHVFIFTGAFILLSALRGRSKSGIASMAIFILCAMSFFCVPMPQVHTISSYVRAAYAPFERLNWILMSALSPVAANSAASNDPLCQSAQGLAVMRFIAFAYLYHYLNWFSKTSIIKWNRISYPRAAVVTFLWMASLWVYAHNGPTGAVLLASLSYAHGFLEMPLDHLTFLRIGREVRALVAERSVGAADLANLP
jgi:hypothetical protein